MTERPRSINRDERYRLHSDSGTAIQYPDGWGLYAWHGVRVPETVIMQPESITLASVLSEKNTEIRRCMIERVGYERFIELAGAEVIHRLALNEGEERLYSFSLPGEDRPWKVVEVICPSTGRHYFHSVKRSVKTVTEAVASMWGLTEDQWKPLWEA